MLSRKMRMARAGVSVGPVVTYLGSAVDGTDTDVYAFSGFNFGSATSADKFIIVGVPRASSSGRTLFGVTVGGLTATVDTTTNTNTTNGYTFAYLSIPGSTTSGSIIVEFVGGPATRCGIMVWSVTGYTSYPTYVTSDTGTGSRTVSRALSCSTGDLYIIGAYHISTTANFTSFTNTAGSTDDFITDELNVNLEGGRDIGAAHAIVTATGTFTGTVTASAAVTVRASAIAFSI